jgi:hypothetical protein
VKWIHSLSVSKCYVSIYVFIWCNHGHTCLVLVSFFTKTFGSFTLIVALAKPRLGALLMAPNPFVMWFINLVVSWFCVMASFCWTTNKKRMHKSQKLFGRFVHPWSFFFLLFNIFVHNWTL